MRHVFRVLVTMLIPALAASAQRSTPTTPQPPAEELQRAAAFFTASDWQHSLEAYTALAKKYPAHPLSRFRIGVSLVGLGRAPEGEASLREGERLGIPAAQAAYRLAQSLAEQHKADAAIAELMRSANNVAPLSAQAIATDPHLASLTSHAKWSAVLDAFDAIAHPCMHDPRNREFDFWVGDWDVRATGLPPVGPAARNNITLEDDGCIVMEHYTTQGPYIGQSFNLFDRSIGKWRQTWVDNTGGQHDYRGGLVGKNMVFIGDTPAPQGRLGRVPTRLTLFNISRDSVRQFSEVSADGGKTWTVSYDLTYVRRK